jgi:hypothetical protein
MSMSIKKAALSMAVLALLSFSAIAQEDIFNVSNKTGMTPGVASKESGVWTPPAVSGSLTNVAGTWTLDLNDDAAARRLLLTLHQNNDAVFGSGEIAVLGNTTSVSAGGVLKGNSLTLYVIPSGDSGLYEMTLTVGTGTLNGNYIFSMHLMAQLNGIATGSQTEVQPVSVVKSTSFTTQLGAGQSGQSASDKPVGPKGTAV